MAKRGIAGRVYQPISSVLGTVKRVVRNSITGVDRIGKRVTRKANNTIRKYTRRFRRRGGSKKQ